DAGDATITLTPREETPGQPQLRAEWKEDGVRAGDAAHFTLRVRDANDLPIASLPLRYWIGPKGTEPPKEEEEWEKASKAATTSAAGEVTGEAPTPSTVVRGVGTTVRVVARTKVEGRDLVAEAAVAVGASAASVELSPEAGAIVPGLEQKVLL